MNGLVPLRAGALNLGGEQGDALVQLVHREMIQILPRKLGRKIAGARPGGGVVKIHGFIVAILAGAVNDLPHDPARLTLAVQRGKG